MREPTEACAKVAERLSAFVDGELAREERRDVEAHCRACPRCAGELEGVRATRRRIASLPKHAVPATFAAEVLQRAVAVSPPHAAPLRRPWYRRPAAAAAALLLVALLCILYAETRIAASRGDLAQCSEAQREISARVAQMADADRESAAAAARMRETIGQLGDALHAMRSEQARAEQERQIELEGLRDTNLALGAEIDTLAATIRDLRGQLAAAERTAPAQPAEIPAVAMIVTGNERVLKPDWSRREAIPTLFDIYESGDPDWRPLAFRLLDDHFRERAAEYVRGRSRAEPSRNVGDVLGSLFGSAPTERMPSARSQELETVRLYKEYWRRTAGREAKEH